MADAPALARGLATALPAGLVLAAVAGAGPTVPLARAWAIVMLAALAAAPLTSSYHFVLLVLPVALLLADGALSRRRRALVVLAFVFATSPLPHYFARFATGWGDLLAYPRLAALLPRAPPGSTAGPSANGASHTSPGHRPG